MAAPARKSQLFSTSVVKEVHVGGSGSKIATFQYKYSRGSTLWQVGLKSRNFPARGSTGGSGSKIESQLSSTNAVKEVHFGRSGSKVATFQHKEVHFGGSGSKIATFQYKCSKGSRSGSKVASFQHKEVHFGGSGSKIATFQYKCSKGSTLWQVGLKSRNFSVHV